MLRHLRYVMAMLVAAGGAGGAAQAAPPPAAAAASAAIDYAQPASWLCRPGQEQACTTDLDALVIDAQGTRTPQKFVSAAQPPIDCFYVYPTVSLEQTPYADMTPSAEVVSTARAQAGRLASRCRLFVPLYRQMTLAGLVQDMAAHKTLDFGPPYADVAAAWAQYLAHDNHGRGVVLIGHSQGTILLQRLIAEQIDGKPAQAHLVAAFLAGDPALVVPQGAKLGGTFQHIPLCDAAGQTGCVYAWGSYLAGATDVARVFGHSPGGGLVAGCVDPAAPAGGKGLLKAYLPRPSIAPASDPSWIEAVGQISANCLADAQGDVLAITVEPSRFADLLTTSFSRGGRDPTWGLHRLDLALPQGNILDDIDAETASWVRR